MQYKLAIAYLAFSLLVGAAFVKDSPAASDRPPNVVLIFADDLGYADIGPYGHPYAVTPNLDRLAAEGAVFKQHYVTGNTCVPSRTGLMTGIYPARYEKYPEYYGFGGRETITSLLNKHGYATGHFGKWHIGPVSSEVDGTYGIDKVRVIESSDTNPEGRDVAIFDAASRFIRENADKPFYVNIWIHSPHFPVRELPLLVKHFSSLHVNRADFSATMQTKFDKCLQIGCDLDASMRTYMAQVYSIDVNVGKIMKVIDELGLNNNTILVFSSDNGPAPIKLSRNREEAYSGNMLGYAGKLSGGKHEFKEGGIRVPFIIRWPGKIEAGRVDTESITSFIDWLPTLGALAGIATLPADLDGQDISDIWLNKSRPRGKPLFWKLSSKASEAVMREGNWKFYMPHGAASLPELYDLSKDPTEVENVVERYPDVVARLRKKINIWVAGLPDSYTKKKKKGKKRSETKN